MTNKIIIVAGDPNSINSEIINKTWKKINKKIKKKIYLIANYELILQQFKKLHIKTKIVKVDKIDANINQDDLKIINVPLKFKNPFNVSSDLSSKYVLLSLNLAHDLAEKKKSRDL